MFYLRRILVINRLLVLSKLEVADRATTCNRAQAMMLLTGNPLSGCAMKLTRLLLSVYLEEIFLQTVNGKRKKEKKKKTAEASPSQGLLRGSLDAWTALPQRLAAG